MSIFAVCGCALLAAVLILLLREWRSSLALPLRVAGALVLFLAAFSLFTPITMRISELFSVAGNSAVAPILFRALGIALVAEFTASLCRDLGESTLSAGVALFGKLEILLLALPFVDDLLSLAKELMEW